MPRPREFDTEAALNGAMEVFWMNGYDGASLPDLLQGMGISRGSLYKAFKDKKSLFMIVLEKYEREAVAQAVEILSAPETLDGWERIMALFNHIVATVREGDRRGCLVCCASAGPASNDPDIARAVHKALEKMHAAFARALGASCAHSGIDEASRHSLADLLTSQYVGLRILSRSHTPVATLRRSVASLGHLRGAQG